MVSWALAHQLAAVNTYFDKDFEDQWTYINARIKRQLGYFRGDQSSLPQVTDAQTVDETGVRLDHRAIRMDSE